MDIGKDLSSALPGADVPSEPYTYEALSKTVPEIRLFTLFPGRKSDDITGILSTASLDAELVYDAVSYLWGEDRNTQVLHLPEGRSLGINSNLSKALRAIRSRTEPRVLWVDAICINQGDLLEREHQVGLMRRVYSQAEVVRAWIDYEATYETSGLIATAIEIFVEEEHGIFDSGFMEDVYDGIAEFFEVPYWTRVWVQQELILARKIIIHVRDETPNYGGDGRHESDWSSSDDDDTSSADKNDTSDADESDTESGHDVDNAALKSSQFKCPDGELDGEDVFALQ